MTERVVDVGKLLDERPIGAFHIKVMVVSFLVMMMDGFDLGAMAFSGPKLLEEFGISKAALGTLLSAGLFAGLFGPPLFGFLADRFGRKRLAVLGAIFFGLFTLASVYAPNFQVLIALRFIAGIGTAGVLPIIVALNSEFAPRRYRATMVVIIFCGVTVGNGIPGLISAHFMSTQGWRLLFWIGGLMPIIMALLAIYALPESARFLALRPNRRAELAGIVRRLDPSLVIDEQTRFVASTTEVAARRGGLAVLFEGKLALLTPLLWVVNLLSMMILNFTNQWMPTLLSTSGFTLEQAAVATSLFQFGGTLGGLVVMRLLDRRGFAPIPVLFAVAVPILSSVGIAGLSYTMLMVAVFCAGFCLLGLQFGIIASEAPAFPTEVRGRGVGSCFAAGRIGSSIGPVIGGVLIGWQLPLQSLFLIASAPLVVGAIVGTFITPIYRRQMSATSQGKLAPGPLASAPLAAGE